MKHVKFYGGSDDLVEVEGDLPGCDEYEVGIRQPSAAFTVAGLKVAVFLANDGCWAITAVQIGEDTKVECENLVLTVDQRSDGSQGYSMVLDMDVPDAATVLKVA